MDCWVFHFFSLMWVAAAGSAELPAEERYLLSLVRTSNKRKPKRKAYVLRSRKSWRFYRTCVERRRKLKTAKVIRDWLHFRLGFWSPYCDFVIIPTTRSAGWAVACACADRLLGLLTRYRFMWPQSVSVLFCLYKGKCEFGIKRAERE